MLLRSVAMRPVLPYVLLLLVGCGAELPARRVLERNLGEFHYRRYQRVLDIELPVDDNPAVAHTATYVTSETPVRIAPVVVTQYEKERGLLRAIDERLRNLSAYHRSRIELEGELVWRLDGESGDSWVLWLSGRHLVKLGVPEGMHKVPKSVLEAYLEQYPSTIPERITRTEDESKS